jgi:hypothetical protein
MERAEIVTDRHYTKAEYLKLLRDSLHKYEYLDGEVRMMAGGDAGAFTYYRQPLFCASFRIKKV